MVCGPWPAKKMLCEKGRKRAKKGEKGRNTLDIEDEKGVLKGVFGRTGIFDTKIATRPP